MTTRLSSLRSPRTIACATTLLAFAAVTGCDAAAVAAPTIDAPAAGAPAAAKPSAPSGGSLAGARFLVSDKSPAAAQAIAWQTSRPADAELMRRLAEQPTAAWFAEWSGDVRTAVRNVVSAAAASGRTAVLVAYNIPHRDCGLYSAGGASGAAAYRTWIRAFADGLRGTRPVVILEPDAAPAASCLPAAAQEERFALLRDAVDVLGAAGAFVYIDAGHSRWMSTDDAAALLTRAGVANAHGFALNVSNFVSTPENASFGEALGRKLGGKRYVVDTSRNGLGPASGNQWCNPEGRAVGDLPTTSTGYPSADAFLWVKVPGESDGTCNGGPGAGQWWAEYALGLARRSSTLP